MATERVHPAADERRPRGSRGAAGAALTAATLALAAGDTNAATITFDWVQTYSTLGAATTSSGVLTLTDPGLAAVTSPATYSGTITSPSSVSFTFTENGQTVTTLPALTGLTITGGVLAPFTDGVAMSSVVSSTSPLSLYVTASGTGLGSLAGLQSAANGLGFGSLWASYVGQANEVAGNGSVTVRGTATLVPPSLTGSVTAVGSGSAGYLGYWQVVPSPVPLPAAAWLLGSALIGLAGIARRPRGARAA